MYKTQFLVNMILALTAIVHATYGQSLNHSYLSRKSSLLQPSSIWSLPFSSTLVSTDNDSLDGNQDSISVTTRTSIQPARSSEQSYLPSSVQYSAPSGLRSTVQSGRAPTSVPPVYSKLSFGRLARSPVPFTTPGNSIFSSQASLLIPSYRSSDLPSLDHSVASIRLAASYRPSRSLNSTAIGHGRNSELGWRSDGRDQTRQMSTRFLQSGTTCVGALPTITTASYTGRLMSATGWTTSQSTTTGVYFSVSGAFGNPDQSATTITVAGSTLYTTAKRQ